MNRIKTNKNPKNLVNPVHFCSLNYLVSGNEMFNETGLQSPVPLVKPGSRPGKALAGRY